MAIERFANNARTVLASAAGSGATSITVADASEFPTEPQFRIRIGQELLLVTGVSGTTWTVTRGVESTTPADHSTNAEVTQVLTAAAMNAMVLAAFQPRMAGGRLTTESGVPLSTSDRINQGTLYYTPYEHDLIALYNGVNWDMYKFAEPSLALSGLTSDANYDVFLYDNTGTLDLELTGWTNDTTRATALIRQDGVLVRSGAPTRRYLGTIRTTSTNATEDSALKRFVWNTDHHAARKLEWYNTTSHSYNSATRRRWNDDTSPHLQFVTGQVQAIQVKCSVRASSTGNSSFGLGVDQVVNSFYPDNLTGFGILTSADSSCGIGHIVQLTAGYHAFSLCEACSGTATYTRGYLAALLLS
jgi:hypothetical protein